MSPAVTAYRGLLAAVLFLFLLLSDWVIFNGPLLSVRHGLLAALALAAVPFLVWRPRSALGVVLAPPVVFFAAFLSLGLALSPLALAPKSAAIHTLVFAAVLLFAVAASQMVSLALTLALLRLALAIKLIISLVFGFVAPKGGAIVTALVNGTIAERHVFGGLFGNPNPLGEAAAACLLLTACHIVEGRRSWPSGGRGLLLAGWDALTVLVSGYLMWQSLSRSAWAALALVVFAAAVATVWRRFGDTASWRRRGTVLLAGALAGGIAVVGLLLWINADRRIGTPNATIAERILAPVKGGGILDTASRDRYWDLALTKIRQRPWTGYGMSATPKLYHQLVGPAREHSHNLELEAALYAGVPAAVLILLFAAATLWTAVQAFDRRRPQALAAAAVLLYFFILAQVEPMVFGSPYPSLLIVLILAAHLRRPLPWFRPPNRPPDDAAGRTSTPSSA